MYSLLCRLTCAFEQLSGSASSCPAPGLQTPLPVGSAPGREGNLAGSVSSQAAADWCMRCAGLGGRARGGVEDVAPLAAGEVVMVNPAGCSASSPGAVGVTDVTAPHPPPPTAGLICNQGLPQFLAVTG